MEHIEARVAELRKGTTMTLDDAAKEIHEALDRVVMALGVFQSVEMASPRGTSTAAYIRDEVAGRLDGLSAGVREGGRP